MSDKEWVVYLVCCADRSLYCGITKDIAKRLGEHNAGKGAKYTQSRKPVEMVAVSPPMTRSDALKLEYRIKKLAAGEKIAALTAAGFTRF
jgi:putative endonuclease